MSGLTGSQSSVASVIARALTELPPGKRRALAALLEALNDPEVLASPDETAYLRAEIASVLEPTPVVIAADLDSE